MKVILLQDVYKKGVAGEVVDVAPGYARNYLIPRSMAMKATPGAMRQYENLLKNANNRRVERDQEFTQIAQQLQDVTLYFSVRAGESGKLYGSVTPGDIAEQLKAERGVEVDRRRVGDRPLRELGEFNVPVRLDASLAPQIKVVVFREGQDPREGFAIEQAVEEEVPEAEVEIDEPEASAEPEESTETPSE
jgi:large subunit ribosomal protein L9